MRLALAALVLSALACGAEEPPAPTCSDGQKNGAETDVDCGGATCGKCALGKACGADGDCGAEATCTAGKCTAKPTCLDHVKNGAETDVDCGGPACTRCSDGQGCGQNGDCADGLECQSNNLCGPKLMGCGDSLDCTQACPGGAGRNACVQDCLNRTSEEGQQGLLALSQCIEAACATKNGGVCDQAAPGYQQMACGDCISATLDDGGDCVDELLACYQ